MTSPARRIRRTTTPPTLTLAGAPSREPPRVFSYTRFSSLPQEHGDSLARQMRLAHEWATTEGLTIDPLTLHDAGRSAYHGRHLEEGGSLAAFLALVEDGTIPRGSILLLESLDRLSRQTPRKAFTLLNRLVDAGIEVVTLADRQRYTAETLDANVMSLFASIMVMVRAHEESDTKARRVRSAWAAKRARAVEDGTPLTGRAPAWLRKEGTEFVLIPERVAIVRRIFTMVKDGMGLQRIADVLNREGVLPFGTPRRRRDGTQGPVKWYRSSVLKIVQSAAVTGSFTPHSLVAEDGRRVRRPATEPIPDYFPRIVPAVLHRAALARRDLIDSTPPSAETRNVLGGLIRCAQCGHTVTRHSKGPGGGMPKLRCTNRECAAPAVPYASVEDALVAQLPALLAEAPVGNAKVLEAQAKRIQGQIEALDSVIDDLMADMERSGVSAAITAKVRRIESERVSFDSELKKVNAEIVRLGSPLVLRQLRALGHSDLTRDRASAALRLRAIVEKVKLDGTAGTLTVEWRAGEAESVVSFGFPSED